MRVARVPVAGFPGLRHTEREPLRTVHGEDAVRTTLIGGAGVAACAVLLVGCGATEEIPTVPEFQFKSGTLAIEEFSSESVTGNVFDPCTEISAEEYEAAGLNDVKPMESEYEFEDINSCDTNLNEAGQRLTIKAGPILSLIHI